MKNLITLIENAKASGIVFDKRTPAKTTWFFSNKANRYIKPNVKIEISSGMFGWPSLAVVREGIMPRQAIVGGQMSIMEKIRLSSCLRRHAKLMTPKNELKNQEKPEGFDNSFGLRSTVTNGELDVVEFENAA